MRNVTISLDDEVARWTRVAAAERDVSVSRFIAELLQARMEQEQNYEHAMARSLARSAQELKTAGTKYPSRDELYD